ncbi:MAG: hypothetical protein LBO75_04425, partial [Bifidobacteriaceae bacterium]|nr:hypothetical protein [Bifidobacteriaceae bacterium]
LVRVSASSRDQAYVKRARLQDLVQRCGREPTAVRMLVDLPITLSGLPEHAAARLDLAEEITGKPLGGGGARFVGTPAQLTQVLVEWVDHAACDGFTFLPTSLPADLLQVVDVVTPALAAAGYRPSSYLRPSPHATTPRAIPVSPLR